MTMRVLEAMSSQITDLMFALICMETVAIHTTITQVTLRFLSKILVELNSQETMVQMDFNAWSFWDAPKRHLKK